VDAGLWSLPPISEILSQPAIATKLRGITEPSSRRLGDEWQESPMMVLDIGETVFQFFRHYELYNSVRVERFLSEYWYHANGEAKKPYSSLSGWENQAMRFYSLCYNTAKQQAEKAKSNG